MGPLGDNNLLFNSGAYIATITMGKLVDDDKDGVQFRGVVSLNDMYSNFSIHQSIHNPYMTLTIHISESKLVFERFGTKGLQGEEFIQIKFETPTMEVIEDLFYVTGYGPIDKDDHDLQTGMVLKCVSKEKLINDQLTVNQSFKGSTSEIASLVYNNHLHGALYKTMKTSGSQFWKEKKLFIDDSTGTEQIIIPGLTPFAAMHFLAVRSFGGATHPGSFFTFYEASDGFHFSNIENWDDKKLETTYTYDSDIKDLQPYHKDFFYNIRYMSPLGINNTLTGIQNGEYATRVTAIDHYKKSFTVTKFDMLDDRKHFNTLGKHFNMSSKFFDTFGKDPVEETIVVDSTTKYKHLPQIVSKRNAYIQLLQHYTFSIVVNGDSSLTAGKVITLDLKEAGAPAKKSRGSMYSGSWMIIGCEHICDRDLFTTRLTIVKDGLKFTHGDV